MIRLLVNIDHVATLRNARGEGVPDPVKAALVCEEAGAAGIVFHLREDRRHIKDDDVYRLKKSVHGTLDFEMAATDEMLAICAEVKPHLATLVPEKREELTTEGGLNMAVVKERYASVVIPHLKNHGIESSLFLDPNPEDIRIAAEIGADAVELHTGTFANATTEQAQQVELDRLREGAELIHELGMKVNAGHGLDLENLSILLDKVPHLADVSIGHALVTESIFSGLEATVKAFLKIIDRYNP